MQSLNDIKNTLLGSRPSPGVGGAPVTGKQSGNGESNGESNGGSNGGSQDGQPPVSAPEIDGQSAMSALTLLAGAFAVLYGRRLVRRNRA
jgi:hypothetical protein